MASSSSQRFETVHGHETITQINDAVFEFHRPATGFVNLDIIFFHGFQAQGSKCAYWREWMLADESACWLNTWLSEEYPQSRIMSVAYDSSTEVTDSDGRMDMYLVGENLTQSIIDLAGVGQSCPVVLVGHGVGGLVLKEVCCRAEELGTRRKARGAGLNPYETFLRNMRGTFFFSTPQLGTTIQANSSRWSPLLKYYELLSRDSARLNSTFQDLRKPDRYGWKTFGIIEGNISEDLDTVIRMPSTRLLVDSKSPVVEEGSGRIDMDSFCVIRGEDSSSICKPKEQSSTSFQLLVNFVREILEDEVWERKIQWLFTLQFPLVYIHIPERVKEVLQTLQLGQSEPSRVSLVGMSGVGKSTLAKELLVEIRSQFDFVCFVNDVKGRLKKQELHTLIAENLFYGSGAKVRMQHADAPSVWRRLTGKKALLIMVNVDSEEQIRDVVSLGPDWLGKGSRLVTTSPERTEEFMPSFLVHEVRLLTMEESVDLFRAHVTAEVLQEVDTDIFHQVVAKCDGLPLAIAVIGSYLRGKKDISIWNDVLERLGNAETINGSTIGDGLWEKLRVSFDKLGRREQKLFLDLAVFEKCEPNRLQYDMYVWKAVWEAGMSHSMVSSGLRNLANKCFIRICGEFGIRSLRKQHGESELRYLALSRDAEFAYIHEQLRDMGRSIARGYDERIEICRGVWQSEDVDELFGEYQGDNAHVETLSVAPNHIHSEKQYPWSSIGRLRKLRLLRMSNIEMSGEGAKRFPTNLAFLQMRGCFRGNTGQYWPIRAADVRRLHKLTVVVLENCSSVCFPDNFHELSSLRVLMLRGEQLTELPEKFGLLPSLRVLVLEHVELAELPDSFLRLSSLESLKLSGCPALLKALPDWDVTKSTLTPGNVQGPLCMLKRMTLEDLPALRELPESFGQLGSLEEVSISRCSALSNLPHSLGMCRKLKDLQITKCDSLECLGQSFGELESLSVLSITSCRGLRCLPDSLGQLKKLRHLEIRDLDVSSLPASIWNLQELSKLRLQGLGYLTGLSEGMGCQMDKTQSIDQRNLPRLPESLGLLRNLEYLEISGCQSLLSLPECLGQFSTLRRIRLADCRSLKRVPKSVVLLRNLESLEIDGRENLQSLRERLGQLSPDAITVDNCISLGAEEEPSRLHTQAGTVKGEVKPARKHVSVSSSTSNQASMPTQNPDIGYDIDSRLREPFERVRQRLRRPTHDRTGILEDQVEMGLVQDQEHETRGCGNVFSASTTDMLIRLGGEPEAQLQRQREQLLESRRLEIYLRKEIEHLISRKSCLNRRLQMAELLLGTLCFMLIFGLFAHCM